MVDRKTLDTLNARVTSLEQYRARRGGSRDPFPEMKRLIDEITRCKHAGVKPTGEAWEFWVWLRSTKPDGSTYSPDECAIRCEWSPLTPEGQRLKAIAEQLDEAD